MPCKIKHICCGCDFNLFVDQKSTEEYKDDKLRKLCALSTDNRAWVCSAFEVRAGGAGVCVAGGKAIAVVCIIVIGIAVTERWV